MARRPRRRGRPARVRRRAPTAAHWSARQCRRSWRRDRAARAARARTRSRRTRRVVLSCRHGNAAAALSRVRAAALPWAAAAPPARRTSGPEVRREPDVRNRRSHPGGRRTHHQIAAHAQPVPATAAAQSRGRARRRRHRPDACAADTLEPLGLYFGTSSGHLFASRDGGESQPAGGGVPAEGSERDGVVRIVGRCQADAIYRHGWSASRDTAGQLPATLPLTESCNTGTDVVRPDLIFVMHPRNERAADDERRYADERTASIATRVRIRIEQVMGAIQLSHNTKLAFNAVRLGMRDAYPSRGGREVFGQRSTARMANVHGNEPRVCVRAILRQTYLVLSDGRTTGSGSV
jgi:hypothetical protein